MGGWIKYPLSYINNIGDDNDIGDIRDLDSLTNPTFNHK